MEPFVSLRILAPLLLIGYGLVFFHLVAFELVVRRKAFVHYAFAALLFVYGLMCFIGGLGAVRPVTEAGFYVGTMAAMVSLAPITSAYILSFLGIKRGPRLYVPIIVGTAVVFVAGSLLGLRGLSWHTVMSLAYAWVFATFALVSLVIRREFGPFRSLPGTLKKFLFCYGGATLQTLALAVCQALVIRPAVHAFWILTTVTVILHALLVRRNPEVYSEYKVQSDSVRESRSRLVGVDVAEKIRRLRLALEEKELYRDSELQVEDLAAKVSLTGPQLSELINKHLSKNFTTFVNEYRVAAAQRALVEAPDRGILDVAFDCGFASKSSFNAVFLKMTGLTPKEFRLRQEKAPES